MCYTKTIGLAVTAVCFLAACASPEGYETRSDQVQRQIYYGTPDSNPAVVAITNGPGMGYFCSGTLITPTVVLTAAHCLEDKSASTIQVMFGDTVGYGTYVRATEAIIHPDYDSYNITNDIALIRLDGSAPANVTPIPALPPGLALTAADEGSTIEITGFGRTETYSSGNKLHISVSLSKVCPGPWSCYFGLGYAVPKSIGYPRTSGGTCYGDSGGPALQARAGQQYAVGVTSYGDADCTRYGVSTKVDDFADFIRDFIGVPEDCAAPGDEDGNGLADCADPECAQNPICLDPDACVQATPIGCGAQITGTTVGAAAEFVDYSCMSGFTEDGPEVAYELTAPAGTTVHASLTIDGSGDLDLFLVPTDSGAGCSPSACLQSSYYGGASPESLTFTMPADGAFLVVDTWRGASAFTLTLSCRENMQAPETNETCSKLSNDEGELIVDCSDPACTTHPICQATPEGIDPVVGGQACNQSGSSPLPALPILLVLIGLNLLYNRKARLLS